MIDIFSSDPTDVGVKARNVALKGALTILKHPRGIVLFAHGSGSSRFSSRNRYVADALAAAKLHGLPPVTKHLSN